MRPRLVFLLSLLSWAIVAGPAVLPVIAQQPPQWEDGGDVEVDGLKVSLSRPLRPAQQRVPVVPVVAPDGLRPAVRHPVYLCRSSTGHDPGRGHFL